MEIEVTHRTPGSEAYLLRRDDGAMLFYDRFAKEVDEVAQPARLVGRGSWLEFDGDPETILSEVRDLLKEPGEVP
jgi:hypothetical protein